MQAAYSSNTPEEERPFTVYAASKTEGERAAWKFVKKNNPGFILNTVLPNMTVGVQLPIEVLSADVLPVGKNPVARNSRLNHGLDTRPFTWER